jgi:hypothetical protein
MPVDSPLVGDWMATIYGVAGQRADWFLSLRPSGEFHRSVRWEGGERVDRGSWFHDEEARVLRLESEEGGEPTTNWAILEIRGLEGANTLLLLREVVLASRNLPLLFSRVHVENSPP